MDNTAPIVFISSRSPRSSAAPLACLEAAMTTAVFGVPVRLVLLGEGVLQLQQGSARELGDRSLARMFGALGLYGIETIHLEAAALQRYGLDAASLLPAADCESPLQVELLQDAARLAQLLDQAKAVFNF
jgi:tRNA 2-thiouridine synthesizing protein C